jgi:hypothetical protein
MGVLLFVLIVGLLIVLGVLTSVHLYSDGALGGGRFKRIRRIRSIKPAPNGPVVEETVEEVMEDLAPTAQVEEEPSF